MAATDRIITLAAFLKWEAPGGDVLLCDGGLLTYDSEVYSSQDSVAGGSGRGERFERDPAGRLAGGHG